MFRLVSENFGFAYVRQIIIINHGYLVNIDKLFYYILSLGNKLVMKFWRNRRCPKKNPHLKVISENSLVPNHEQYSIHL